MNEIGKLFNEAQRSGLAVCELTLRRQSHLFEPSLMNWLEWHDLEPLKNRTHEGLISELTPKSQKNAHPLSLSATTGLGKQPMHTDGAHLRTPPDFTLLWSSATNKTTTQVWRVPPIPYEAQNGIFAVHNGKERWLTQAYNSGTVRFDPGCMTPADQSAIALSHILTTPHEKDIEHIRWDTNEKLVVIDNKHVLHCRSSLANGDDRRCLKRLMVKRK